MGVTKSIFNVLRFNSRNWRAIVLCFFAATIFWLFNSLNKDYTTNVSFPVRFEYDEENYIPVKPLPAGVRINVTGMGWDLFRRSLGFNIPPLVIPLERPSEIKKIVAIPALFAYQMERLDINFVVSDTFRIAIEPKSNRWISLRLDASSIQLEKDRSNKRAPATALPVVAIKFLRLKVVLSLFINYWNNKSNMCNRLHKC